MAKYQKTESVGGAWAKGSEIMSGIRAKIISEARPVPSQYKDKDGKEKTQDVAKVQFEGMPEALNVSLNRATVNALVDAFGEDSLEWVNNPLRVETEKVRVAGAAKVAMYFIPEGFEKIDDDNGYAKIVRKGSEPSENVSDLPF